MSLCPVHFLLTSVHIPLANGSDDFQRRIKSLDGGLETNLVVALARAAMSNVLGAVLMGGIYQVLGDQRTRKSGNQRILVLEVCVGIESLGQVVCSKVFTHVGDDAVDCTRFQSALLNLLEAFVLLANFAHYSDNVKVLFVLQPLDADAGVQATRICEYALILCHFLNTFHLAIIH